MAITVTINGKQYTFRNLEEQVLFLTEELEKVQQSLGNALPDPIPGPQGEPGATGGPGPIGPRGKGIYGCSSSLPSPTAYQEGDMYLLFNGELYKKVSGSWVMQTTLKGPQGVPGLDNPNDVIANPVGESTDDLSKIEISGTVYDITTPNKLFGKFVKIINAPSSTTLTDEEKQNIIDGSFMEGNFLGYKNPLFCPAELYQGVWYGIFIASKDTGDSVIREYGINDSTNVVTLETSNRISMNAIYSFNGKEIPTFPNSPSTAQVLTYQPSNQLVWVNERKKLYQHNITITFNDNNYIVFTIVCNYDEPIVDISELLEYKYQLEQLPALYYSGQVYDGVVINLPQNGNFSFDVGGGNQTYDYNDDITDITDHFVPLN